MEATLHGGELIPASSRGHLIFVDGETAFRVYGTDGKLCASGVEPNGAHIRSVAVGPDGAIALGWKSDSANGIDLLDEHGQVKKTFHTGIFWPSHLAFDVNGDIWAFGEELKPGTTARPKDYATVRKYSADGKQIGAYLPRSLFAGDPASGWWQRPAIFITKDRVGVWATSGQVVDHDEWLEMGLNGKVLGRWPIEKWPEQTAMTDADRVYVELRNGTLLKLDREPGSWQKVPWQSNARLYGWDGDQLFFVQKNEDTLDLDWYHPL